MTKTARRRKSRKRRKVEKEENQNAVSKEILTRETAIQPFLTTLERLYPVDIPSFATLLSTALLRWTSSSFITETRFECIALALVKWDISNVVIVVIGLVKCVVVHPVSPFKVQDIL